MSATDSVSEKRRAPNLGGMAIVLLLLFGALLGGIDASLPPLHGTVKSDGGETLTVSGMPTSDQFHVVLDDGSTPHVVWSVDDTRIGSIGADGDA